MAWCIARTRYKEEERALQNLIQMGFNVLLPRLRVHRGKELELQLMFPRYIFIEINEHGKEWRYINNTRGVLQVFTSTPERPSLVPVSWMEQILTLGGVVEKFEDTFAFKRGDQLRFKEGPFKGHVGRCEWSTEHRVALLMNVLGHENIVLSEITALQLIAKADQDLR